MADLVEKTAGKRWESSCEICGESSPKYRCPACGHQTCSLLCVKQHKAQLNCSGVRCKTEFISKDNYGDNEMLSDYRFLEDANRVASLAARDRRGKWRPWKARVMKLRKGALQSGVRLYLMPDGMSKRRQNTSYFNAREKKIMWRIKWLFPQAGAEYVDSRVPESEIMKDLLKKYIDPGEADPVIKQRLKCYCAVGVDNVCVFLKSECQPANTARYFHLDTSQTLRKCLECKSIVEFPTLHVVLPENTNNYL